MVNAGGALAADAVFAAPGEPVLGARPGPVFAGRPARPAEPVERLEHTRIVDLALVRLGARRHRGDLHVADQRLVRLEAPDEIAADDLHMIKIELDLHIRPPDLGADFGGLLDPLEEI